MAAAPKRVLAGWADFNHIPGPAGALIKGLDSLDELFRNRRLLRLEYYLGSSASSSPLQVRVL
jgi:hypothetical protein